MEDPTLIVICGWPMSGKTTLATTVRQHLNVHHIDIDEVRWLMVGQPYPHPNESPELMKRNVQEMGMAYRLLIAGAHENLAAGRSVLITATFSRRMGQEMLHDLMAKHHGARLHVIQCIPQCDTPEEVARIISARDFGEGGYKGAVNSPERYFEVKGRYDPIELPHLKIATWGASSVEDETRLALEYILSPDPAPAATTSAEA